jgi:uncharacterized membrane protein
MIVQVEPRHPSGYDAVPDIAQPESRMRINPVNNFKAQPRLFSSIVFGVLLWFALPHDWRQGTRLLMSWDCSTGLYLVLAGWMMARSNIVRMRYRADLQDEGQVVILGLTTITALVSLAGIMAQLSAAKTQDGSGQWRHIALAGLTVVLSWTFTHTMFAIHYAHEYYGGPEDKPTQGLEFPGHDEPDYWDFVYYSFVIGTACATADVNLTSRTMRRTTTLHCIVAFFFNTTILALTVNIGAGFF